MNHGDTLSYQPREEIPVSGNKTIKRPGLHPYIVTNSQEVNYFKIYRSIYCGHVRGCLNVFWTIRQHFKIIFAFLRRVVLST